MIRRTPGPPSISASTSALLQSHSHSWLCSVNLIATASETPRLIRRTPRPPPISASTSALLQSHSQEWLCYQKAKPHERDICKRNQLRTGQYAFRLESPFSRFEFRERFRPEQRTPRGSETKARPCAARPGASISRRRCRGAPPRDSPHSPGASFLARPAIRLVESQRHELAPALRAALQRRPAARGHAALSIRHEFLSGLRSVLHRRPLAGRAKRPLLPAVAAIARGYFRGARRQRRGRAH